MDEKETHKDFLIDDDAAPDDTQQSAAAAHAEDMPATTPSDPAAAPEMKSGMPAWLRRGLIWLGGLLLVFVAGALVIFFTTVQPLNAELADTQQSLASAEAQVASLEGELSDAQATIEALRIEQARFQLQQVLLKATEAKAALLTGDTVEVQVKLESVKNALRPLTDELEAYDATLATSLPQRIELIETNLETNPDKALVDLDLLIDDLQAANDGMF